MNRQRRSSKACDHCREAKSKCEQESDPEGCKRCKENLLRCTSQIPSRRRGPPKGYLHLVETKMHELEAVMGVMLSIPDPRLQEIIGSLSKDELCSSVFAKVSDSPFGPHAIQNFLEDIPDCNETPSPKPTNAWQKYALRKYVQEQIIKKRPHNDLSEINLLQFPMIQQEQISSPLGSDSGSSFSIPITSSDAGSSNSITLKLPYRKQVNPQQLWSEWMDWTGHDLSNTVQWPA